MAQRLPACIGLFALTLAALVVTVFWAVMTGGLNVELPRLLRGLFVVYDRDVAIIIRLRFPRIVVALLAGAMLSVSGVFLQALLRNPLADPGIIGVNAGAAFASAVVFSFFPGVASMTPFFAFLGGAGAFGLVFVLSKGTQMSPVRLILTGIAVGALFQGLGEAIQAATGQSYTGAASMINANVSQKTWADARMLFGYTVVSVVLCLLAAGRMNLLALSDETIISLGVHITALRAFVAVSGVLMASIVTAIVGGISFLALIVPHIARLLVGSDHKRLVPYSALLGAVVFLSADTVGRSIVYPYEISPSIVMAVIGGPVFLVLIRRGGEVYGN